jgi:hypothetical protein
MLFVGKRRTTDMPSVSGNDNSMSPTGYGVAGRSNIGNGVLGIIGFGPGVRGYCHLGIAIQGDTSSGDGVYGRSVNGYAAFLEGNVRITGNLQINGDVDSGSLQKAGGSFKIVI